MSEASIASEHLRQLTKLAEQVARLTTVVDDLVEHKGRIDQIIFAVDEKFPGLAMQVARNNMLWRWAGRIFIFASGGSILTLSATMYLFYQILQMADKAGGM